METVLSVLRLSPLSAAVSASGGKRFSPNAAQQTSVRKKAPDGLKSNYKNNNANTIKQESKHTQEHTSWEHFRVVG